jgi:hypothetical protein
MIKRGNLIAKDMSIKETLKWITRLVVGLAVMLIPCYSHANNIYTYIYTGNAYEQFTFDGLGTPQDQYDNSNNVTAVLTFEQPLTPSYDGVVTPSSFAVSDGLYTITQDNVLNASFRVVTDIEGNINEWSFAAQAVLWSYDLAHAVLIDSTYSLSGQTRDSSLDGVCGDSDNYEEIIICIESSTPEAPGYNQSAYVIDNPGTWTVSQVPEPSSHGGDDGGCFITTLIN